MGALGRNESHSDGKQSYGPSWYDALEALAECDRQGNGTLVLQLRRCEVLKRPYLYVEAWWEGVLFTGRGVSFGPGAGSSAPRTLPAAIHALCYRVLDWLEDTTPLERAVAVAERHHTGPKRADT